jgi:septal ring factor EnvC (AmiA/AmiB activator)
MLKSKKEVSLRSYEALERKVIKLEETNKKVTKELSDKKAECRDLRKDKNRISKSRDRWKVEAIELRHLCKEVQQRYSEQMKALKPKGHQYPTWLITLVVILRIYCNCPEYSGWQYRENIDNFRRRL